MGWEGRERIKALGFGGALAFSGLDEYVPQIVEEVAPPVGVEEHEVALALGEQKAEVHQIVQFFFRFGGGYAGAPCDFPEVKGLGEKDDAKDGYLGLGAEKPFQHVLLGRTVVILKVTFIGERSIAEGIG
jgi:hypothetical protein